MSLLSIANLHIAFDSTKVVDNVSLTLEQGEVLAIVGESGSGKSLTALSVLQLLPGNAIVSGNVQFKEETLLSKNERAMEAIRGNKIGMIFQEPMTALNPLHPIRRQILEAYCLHQRVPMKSKAAKAKLQELYEAVGLQHLSERGTVYPHQLSGGERQRVMIAMAIANDPELLIADEPTTALDVTLQAQILKLLKLLQQERQMGMIFITHDLLIVQQIADRVAVMHDGKIVETGKVKDIFAAPKHAYTKMLLAAAPQGNALPLKPDAKEIISCNNVSVNFLVKSPVLRRTLRVVHAVQNVSFSLHSGETLGVVGESGSGKSSLGYALLRLVPSTGPIVFLGERMDAFDAQQLRTARSDAQIVFQDPYSSLNPRMSVGEIVAEGLKLHAPASTDIDVAVDEILQQVGLKPAIKHRYPHEFSGGQRQRIAIARAMILKPKLLVLDEPTSALDMSVQRQVLELLKSIQQSHDIAYIFISHDLRVIKTMAHQVLVLKRGNVVEQGTSKQLFDAPQHEYTRTLLTAAFGAAI